MNPVFEQMSRIGIIPVIALDDAGDAAPFGRSIKRRNILCRGDVPDSGGRRNHPENK